MFDWLFSKSGYKIDPLNEAMSLYEQAYMNDIRGGFSVEVAEASAVAAAEGYMTQYLVFKERGL